MEHLKDKDLAYKTCTAKNWYKYFRIRGRFEDTFIYT